MAVKLNQFCLQLSKCQQLSVPLRSLVSFSSSRFGTFEPSYLDMTKHMPKKYRPVNIQIKGHNFDILESYQSFVHNLVENIGLTCSDSWATAGNSILAKTYDENSTVIKDTCLITTYERNVQVNDLRSIDAPLLIDILRRTLPEGEFLTLLTFFIARHFDEFFQILFCLHFLSRDILTSIF